MVNLRSLLVAHLMFGVYALRPVMLIPNCRTTHEKLTFSRTSTRIQMGGGGGCGCGGKNKLKGGGTIGSNNNLNSLVSSGYFPNPSFRVMHTGEGTVTVTTTNHVNALNENETSSITTILDDCLFAQFGPLVSFSGNVQLASPLEAHEPLDPLQTNDSPIVVVVKRGLCSFEAKMRAARDIGAKAVILVNNDDETFLAVSETVVAENNDGKSSNKITPPPNPEEDEIPFVVVPSSAGQALKDGVHVSIKLLDTGKSKCWGSWDTMKSPFLSGKGTAGVVEVGDKIGERFVLPLFPVSKEPLLPGVTLQMQLGKRECDEMEHYLQQQRQQQIDATTAVDDSTSKENVIHVAVAYCLDPTTNILAETACLATVDLTTSEKGVGARRLVTFKGIEPCTLRTLIRDSTRAGLGLGLIVPKKPTRNDDINTTAENEKEGVSLTDAATEIREKIQKISIFGCTNGNGGSDEHNQQNLHALPADPDELSFAACKALGLPPRQQQAALACSTFERLDGIKQILNRIDTTEKNIGAEGKKKESISIPNSSNFVSAAVKKILPSVVRVELPGSGGSNNMINENKAAGFIVDSDGIIATNRHVVAKAVDDGSSPMVTVTLQDGVALPAEILAVSESYDIAFLKVDQSQLPVAPLGDVKDVQLGDWMIAIGSPAEFDNLVSLGIASTIQRPPKGSDTGIILDTNPTFIGTDALFNKGISGGPLINDTGDVVGMCTYLREDLNGLGFAISINRVLDAAHELLNGKNIMQND